MNPGVIDLLLAALLTFVFPVYGVWEYRRFVAALDAEKRRARVQAYLQAMAVQWAVTVAMLVSWLLHDRGLALLGLGRPGGTWFWIGGAAAAVVIGLAIAQNRSILHDPAKRREVRAQLENVRAVIPTDRTESRLFRALAVTAGICEEALYRGFLLVYLATWTGIPFAVLISSAIFGLGHLYQGRSGILKTGATGLAMAGLTLLTGSLWIPMALHAAIDLCSGHLGTRLLDEDEEGGPEQEIGDRVDPDAPGQEG